MAKSTKKPVKKTTTKKTNTTKKTTKKAPVKKETVVKEEVKVEKVEKKEEERKLLSDFKIAVLYSICALCWLLSGILEYVASKKVPYLDIVITIILVVLALVYFKKDKKNK